MKMKKIQKLIFTLACLLTVTTGYADTYKITRSSQTGNGTVELKTSEDAAITVGTTEITVNSQVKIVVTPSSGYYLDKITLSYVLDLNHAETRGPGFAQKVEINRNTAYSDYFGGTYTFNMPSNHVEIDVTFTPCVSTIASAASSIALDNAATYNGSSHKLVVNDGALKEGEDFSVAWTSPSPDTDVKNVGNYIATITGIGKYYGTQTTGTLTISPKPINVSANARSKVFGNSDPTLTYTADALCTGDHYSGALTRAAGENVGTYAISQGSLTAGSNYSITFTGANLTITRKVLTSPTVSLGSGILSDGDGYYYNAPESPTSYTPSVTSIMDGSVSLLNTDYSVSYTTAGVFGHTDHTTPDIYYVDIDFNVTGGNYSGTYQQPYQIRKKVTLSDTWVTYYEPDDGVNMKTMPETNGFKAYIISSVGSNAITLTEESYIKRGVPMVLKKEGATASFYPPLGLYDVGSWSSVTGFTAVGTTPTDVSSVATSGYSIWILVDGSFVRTKEGTLPAGKCYLKISDTQVSTTRLFWGYDTTDIGSIVKDVMNESHWYTLDGRRLQGPPSRKGIYIVNGKKVVIK